MKQHTVLSDQSTFIAINKTENEVVFGLTKCSQMETLIRVISFFL